MFLMMAEVLQLPRSRGVSRQLVLERSRVPPDARRVGRLLAARPDSAVVLVSGRRGAAVLDRSRGWREAGRSAQMFAHAALAVAAADRCSASSSARSAQHADELHVRRHAVADRPRLSVPVSARVRAAALAVDGAWRDSRRVLGWRWRCIRCRAPDFDYAAVGVPADWPHHYTGFAAHWNKNTNLGMGVRHLVPQSASRARSRSSHNGGGYATLSFIPTLGTMILGLIAGRLAAGDRSAGEPMRLAARSRALIGSRGLLLALPASARS